MASFVASTKSKLSRTPGVPWVGRLIAQIRADDITGIAAQTAFFWIFAIPPLMILVVMSGALMDQTAGVSVVTTLRNQIDKHAPEDTVSILNRLVDNGVAEVSGGAASLGVLIAAVIALWSGSNGMGALMKAFNSAYDVEEGRPFIRKRAVSIGLTLLLIAILNGAFVLLVYGRRIGNQLASELGAGDEFETVWSLIIWPLALALVVFVLTLLYYFGPNVQQQLRKIIPGAIAATGLWLVAVFGFGYYLQFSDPGSAYGALGGIVVFLFFLYLTAIILVVGAEINVLRHLEDSETTLQPRVPPNESSLDEVEKTVS